MTGYGITFDSLMWAAAGTADDDAGQITRLDPDPASEPESTRPDRNPVGRSGGVAATPVRHGRQDGCRGRT